MLVVCAYLYASAYALLFAACGMRVLICLLFARNRILVVPVCSYACGVRALICCLWDLLVTCVCFVCLRRARAHMFVVYV